MRNVILKLEKYLVDKEMDWLSDSIILYSNQPDVYDHLHIFHHFSSLYFHSDTNQFSFLTKIFYLNEVSIFKKPLKTTSEEISSVLDICMIQG